MYKRTFRGSPIGLDIYQFEFLSDFIHEHLRSRGIRAIAFQFEAMKLYPPGTASFHLVLLRSG